MNRRRLDFVSAVTHELRTPLTTFTMYTEMLKEGMVPEAKRPGYYEALFEESRRLSHLVRNVLDYARIEARRMTARARPAMLREHFEKIRPPARRALRCGGSALSAGNASGG